MREIKSITGLRVISVDEGASVGTVSQVVVDLSTGAMLGIVLGNGAGERGVEVGDIQTIGSDVIMISSREVARHLSEMPALEKGKAAGGHMIPVFTDSGRRLGVVSGIYIDPYEKSVTRYEVSSGALKDLADGILVLPIVAGTVHGQDAVILPDSAVREMGRETGGLFARFSQWGDSARKQYQQVAENAEKMVETGSEALKKEAAIVRDKAKEVSEKAKAVGEKVGEKAKDVSEKAREVGEKIGEKAVEVGAEAREAVAHIGGEKSDEAKPAEAAHDASAEQIVPVEETALATHESAPAGECGESEEPPCGCGCGCDSQES